jgi:hypothetical protein
MTTAFFPSLTHSLTAFLFVCLFVCLFLVFEISFEGDIVCDKDGVSAAAVFAGSISICTVQRITVRVK